MGDAFVSLDSPVMTVLPVHLVQMVALVMAFVIMETACARKDGLETAVSNKCSQLLVTMTARLEECAWKEFATATLGLWVELAKLQLPNPLV